VSAISSTGVGELLDRLLTVLPAAASADDIAAAGGMPAEDWCASRLHDTAYLLFRLSTNPN
jgi:hypothetical protein